MNILEDVKLLLGIHYEDELKDKEILSMIELASNFLIDCGWHVMNINNKSFMNAIVIYIKYYQNSELPTYDLLDTKLLKSLISQNRGIKKAIILPQDEVNNNDISIELINELNTKINELQIKIDELEESKLSLIEANKKFDAINIMLLIAFNHLTLNIEDLEKMNKLITISEKGKELIQ